MHCLSLAGRFEQLKNIIEKGGVCIFAKSPSDGGTALHRSAEGAHTECANLLFESGADIDTTNSYGQTPLHVAAEHGNFDFVKFLVKRGARRICQNNCVRCTLCNKMINRQNKCEKRRQMELERELKERDLVSVVENVRLSDEDDVNKGKSTNVQEKIKTHKTDGKDSAAQHEAATKKKNHDKKKKKKKH